MKVLEVNHVWIKFKTVKPFSYRNIFNKRLNDGDFSAVKDVSFSLEKGECLGIIGANGSGKSTLLRGIANIYTPDKGEIKRYCEKISLLSLGVGFQSRLNGRQNIVLSGLALGFSKKEIVDNLDAIIEFSELGDFIDKPVKTYSSGMYSKLAFSISVMLKTELLLIDEILSVGDMRFRKKSYAKLSEIISHKDQSVIIVSHDESTLASICDRIAWIDGGELISIGNAETVLEQYKAFMNASKDKRGEMKNKLMDVTASDRTLKNMFTKTHSRISVKRHRPHKKAFILIGLCAILAVAGLLLTFAIFDRKTPLTVVSTPNENVSTSVVNTQDLVSLTVNPYPSEIVDTEAVQISGSCDPKAKIATNATLESEIEQNTSGTFSFTVKLNYGVNKFQITATLEDGRQALLGVKITRKPDLDSYTRSAQAMDYNRILNNSKTLKGTVFLCVGSIVQDEGKQNNGAWRIVMDVGEGKLVFIDYYGEAELTVGYSYRIFAHVSGTVNDLPLLDGWFAYINASSTTEIFKQTPTPGTSSFPSQTTKPTISPTTKPTTQPTTKPSAQPSATPSAQPSATSSAQPSATPSAQPSATPSSELIPT